MKARHVAAALLLVLLTSSLSHGQTSSGNKLRVPEETQKRFGTLVDGLKQSSTMNDEERQYWINLLPKMSQEQLKNLRRILEEEQGRPKSLTIDSDTPDKFPGVTHSVLTSRRSRNEKQSLLKEIPFMARHVQQNLFEQIQQDKKSARFPNGYFDDDAFDALPEPPLRCQYFFTPPPVATSVVILNSLDRPVFVRCAIWYDAQGKKHRNHKWWTVPCIRYKPDGATQVWRALNDDGTPIVATLVYYEFGDPELGTCDVGEKSLYYAKTLMKWATEIDLNPNLFDANALRRRKVDEIVRDLFITTAADYAKRHNFAENVSTQARNAAIQRLADSLDPDYGPSTRAAIAAVVSAQLDGKNDNDTTKAALHAAFKEKLRELLNDADAASRDAYQLYITAPRVVPPVNPKVPDRSVNPAETRK